MTGARVAGGRRRPVRPLLAAAAVLVAVLPVRVAEAGLPGSLTITGTRTAYVDLTVREETFYRLDGYYTGATVDYAGGRWGGFAIGLDKPHLETVHDPYYSTIDGYPSEPVRDRPGSVGRLAPGTHRVYLFADGQRVTVRVPWSAPDVTLEAVTPLDASISVATAVLVPGREATLALPQDGGPGTVTAAGLHWREAGPNGPYRIMACFARPPESWERCDRRLGSFGISSGEFHPAGTMVMSVDGSPKTRVTAGRSYFVQPSGAPSGVLTAATVRYRPRASDLRRYPIA